MTSKLPSLISSLIIFTVFCQLTKANEDTRWWPVQKAPENVVIVDWNSLEFVELANGDSSDLPSLNLVESMSGLAARSVNNDSLNEMVWLYNYYRDYVQWYESAKTRLQFSVIDTLDQWQLLERYKNNGLVKGYVLYSVDTSPGNLHTFRFKMNHSVNVATVAASVYNGVLISEELEAKVQEMGLPLLFDARGKNEAWAFYEFKDNINKTIALAQEPKANHNRDIAIAHNMMVFFGMGEVAEDLYKFMEPKSTVIGWNLGNEGDFVHQISKYGHIVVASNWSLNLTLLSAGTENWQLEEPCKILDPNTIDFDDDKHSVSFVLSDGDNLQWLMTNFVNHPYYWANPDFGSFPFNFGICLGDLNQACPEVLSEIQRTQPDNSSVILHGGGYYYPDVLGISRTDVDRYDILYKHAKQISHQMKIGGSRILMFIAEDIDSEEAKEAYQVFAEEIDDLLGMLVMQYYPYEGGDGKIFWYENHDGVEIPVVSANYSLWANLNLPGSGTPAKIARLINEKSESAESNSEKYNGWTVVHAWSGFQYNEGDDEQAENGQYLSPGNGFEAGVSPAKWCVDRLDTNIKVVTAEEMLWRIRMRNNPEQTRALIAATNISDPSNKSWNTPSKFELFVNYPNPFNPTTNISYQILEKSFVSLEVFDMLGRSVASLVNENKAAGRYSVEFNGTDLASGVYIYKLSAGNFVQSKKLVLLK